MRPRDLSLVASVLLLLSTLFGAANALAQATPATVACTATPVAAATTYPLVITDDAGRSVTIARAPARIVSIAPSNTEILFALGLDEQIVGVDSYSDYPPQATQKPQVGSYIEPDLERVVAASPDLVLATEAHLDSVVPRLEALGLTTVVLEPRDLDGVLADIDLVGAIANASAHAQALDCTLQARVDAVTAAVAGAPRPRAFFELSPDLYTAGPGSFVDDLITRAGGDNVSAGAAEMWPQMSAEAVVSADPEVIILADHGAGVTPEEVAARPGWGEIAAVRDGRVVSLEDNLVDRPGPRVVDGLEAIATALHPDLFPGLVLVKLLAATPAERSFTDGVSQGLSTLVPIVVAALGVCLAGVLALMVGKAPLPPGLSVELLLSRLGVSAGATSPPGAETILLQIRLPRIVLAGVVGGALAIAGATHQGVFRNPLADPYLLGVASGASLGAVLAFVLPIPWDLSRLGLVQGLAFLGAAVAVVTVYLLARVGGGVPTTTLLLAGVAVSAAASAATAYVMYIRGDQLLVIYSWLLGGFNVAGWQEVRLVTPLVLLSAGIMIGGGRVLNALQFGEEQAAALGIAVEPSRLLLIGAATLATAAAVSVAGLIGFVGLVVPHVTRLLLGPDYRRLVPAAALLGAAFLIVADAGARAAPGPSEVPVGIITAAIGAPFFLFLLRRQKRFAFW